MASKKEKMPEKVRGSFSAFPHSVCDSNAFVGASDKAKALMLALVRQLNGKNNGHLQLTTKWLSKQGYTCPASNIKARKELIERGLVVQTRFGGLNMGADLFAVTWLDITNTAGLDITLKGFNRSEYLLCDLPPTSKRKQPIKKSKRFSQCNSAVSVSETEGKLTVSVSETKKAITYRLPVSVSENNVSIPIHLRKHRVSAIKHRIVGVKGKSGLRKPAITNDSKNNHLNIT